MRKIVIIGAGVIGCSVARELSRYEADITVIEKHSDVSCGTSKANSGIVHAGFDAKPNTLKAKFNVLGNPMFDKLSKDLEFPFRRCGAMVLCFSENDYPQLTELYQKGLANGVKDLEVLPGDKAREIEPYISKEVVAVLHAPTSGIVGPYEMTIALFENARANGANFVFNKEVSNVVKSADKWIVSTQDGDNYEADMVINCAGVYSDKINNLVSKNKIEIVARKGEYMLLDKACGYYAQETLFQLPTKMGKGILVSPTTHGNILLGPTATDIEDKDNVATTVDGLNTVFQFATKSVPTLNKRMVITQFSGLRAHNVDGDFVIGEAEDAKGFYNCTGIESPGLTSAPAIGDYVAKDVAKLLDLVPNTRFIPTRKAIPEFSTMSDSERAEIIKENPLYGNIVCRCEVVTEGEIVEAIKRGATDFDGVKRRTRAGMGRCQSGFCKSRVMEILARELNKPLEEVTQFGEGSYIVEGKVK